MRKKVSIAIVIILIIIIIEDARSTKSGRFCLAGVYIEEWKIRV